jgi:HlyD family secretion protein
MPSENEATPPAPAPRRLRGRRSAHLAGLGAAALLLVGGGIAFALLHHPAGPTHGELVLHTVKYERVETTIAERGDLEPAVTSDVECRVKSGTSNSTNSTVINWVVDEGTWVRGPRPDKPTGDLLVELDDSGLQEQKKTQRVVVNKALSDRIQAEEVYKITVSQNDSDIKTAETQVELAALDLMKYTGLSKEDVLKPETLARLRLELRAATRADSRAAQEIAAEDLKKYRTGGYLSALKDSLGQVEGAETDLSQEEDREAWTYRMARKGYQTANQALRESALKETYQLALNKAILGLDVLVKYTKVSQLTQYLTAMEEARRGLERTRSQAHAKEVQARTDREGKRQVWEIEEGRLRECEAEIARCRIYAPHDGLVLYFVSSQVRWGNGSQQSIIAQGEPVREGQKLIQLPDLRQLQVSIRIHEAAITRVHRGQPAMIQADARSDRALHGHVQSIATFATQVGWSGADVRAYVTKVVIDPDDIEGLDLRPGMSAHVTISADAAEHVLAVPTEAISGGSELGSERKVFVMTPDGPEERAVTVGVSNSHLAEIKTGLNEGDQVIVNSGALSHEESSDP